MIWFLDFSVKLGGDTSFAISILNLSGLTSVPRIPRGCFIHVSSCLVRTDILSVEALKQYVHRQNCEVCMPAQSTLTEPMCSEKIPGIISFMEAGMGSLQVQVTLRHGLRVHRLDAPL